MTAHDARDVVSAAAIAAEIARTRARLSHSLAVLDREYALRSAFVHGTRMLHATEPDAGRLREALRRQILPLSLIGAGLAWLTLAGRRADGDAAGRLLRGITQLQQFARELLAFANAGEARPATGDGG